MPHSMPEPLPKNYPAYCCWNDEHPCVCADDERALRKWVDALPGMPPMTPDQRAWCLSEIAQAGDATDQGDFSHEPDHLLARQVLTAWRDVARDKGVI